MNHNPDDKILSVTMADCDLSTFSVGGAGGQRRDHTNTGVMIKHRASGAVGRGTSSRSQLQNKRAPENLRVEFGPF